MIEELLAVGPGESFGDLCARMGVFLGLDGALSENVMRRAIEDSGFAGELIACREAPDFLQSLLEDPANAKYGEPAAIGAAGGGGDHAAAAAALAPGPRAHSDLQLVQRAGAAMVRWGMAGFSTVSTAVLEKRENACLSCEHLVKPKTRLQKMAVSSAGDRPGARAADGVCGVCGCSVGKKIRLPTESCPSAHPHDSNLTRWGEPVVRK